MSRRVPLIVAATEAEVAELPPGLPRVITGMGKTAAGVRTAEALARAATEAGGLEDLVVLNLGSAGALRDGLVGIHLPGRVVNHDLDAVAIRALGYEPEHELTVGDDPMVLASGDIFVSDPAVRARLAERAHLVDMEGYGVAYACQRFGVRLLLVKHVSDNADESALDWPDLVHASAVALAEWVERWLDEDA